MIKHRSIMIATGVMAWVCLTPAFAGEAIGIGVVEGVVGTERLSYASGRVILQLQPGIKFKLNGGDHYRFTRANDLARSNDDSTEDAIDLANDLMAEIGAQRIEYVFAPGGYDDIARDVGLDRYVVLSYSSGVDPSNIAGRLGDISALFESASVDHVGYLTAAGDREPIRPTDPLYIEQWGLDNFGQVVDGKPGLGGADINISSVWSIKLPQERVVIAVVDTGVSPTHPDLIEKLIPGFNALGDPEKTDDGLSSHGTHVAGIAAASANNGVGITGVSWNALIMPIRVLNEFGWGFETEFAAGLQFAVDNGADIASMSLGFPQAGDLLRDSIRYADEAGVLLVASAGNSPGVTVRYPARYPETMAVSATTNFDEIWDSSTTGPEVSISAPGLEILSTWDTPTEPATYARLSGTSMSTPMVSGVAALVMTANHDLSAEDVRWVIETAALDLGEPGRDDQFGFGRLDAMSAVVLALSLNGDSCGVDFNGDGVADFFDIVEFLALYAAGDPLVDIAEPFGVIDFFDVSAFLEAFAAGCD